MFWASEAMIFYSTVDDSCPGGGDAEVLRYCSGASHWKCTYHIILGYALRQTAMAMNGVVVRPSHLDNLLPLMLEAN